jgi:hypothetical protein
MATFNLADYETVADRIKKFWADNPNGAIVTELIESPKDGGEWVVKAYAYKDRNGAVASTGLASEVPGKGMVNTTSALENCETSAIARSLANLNYATSKQRASREEMAKVARGARPTVDTSAKQGELMELMEAATTKEELRVIYNEAKKLGLKAVEDAVTLKADKLN